MIISFKTLQNYIEIDQRQFRNFALNLHKFGFELNSVNDNYNSEKFVVGRVIKIQHHPNAKSLFVCQVQVGHDKIIQIICGARNIQEAKWVVVARIGAILSGGEEIIKRTIRGVVSEGMICSLSELDSYFQKTVPADEIHQINNQNKLVVPGDHALKLLGLEDMIIDCEATYNLHNELGIFHVACWIAREYNLKIYEQDRVDGVGHTKVTNDFTINNFVPDFCQNVGWAVINEIKASESPAWIKHILRTYKIKTISPIVDLTNLVMLEHNQPMHAYDRDQINDNVINFTHQASNNHKSADFINYKNIDCSGLYVAITQKKQYLLGILAFNGAILGSITAKTRSIIIESSSFTAHLVRQESKKIQMDTQAGKLFSKPMHELKIHAVIKRFCTLGVKLNYFKNFSPIHFNCRDSSNKTYQLSISKIAQVIGVSFKQSELCQILASLFDKVVWITADKVSIEVPSWRIDLENEMAVIEQILKTRVVYDKISEKIYTTNSIVQANINPTIDVELLKISRREMTIQRRQSLLSRLLVLQNFTQANLFLLCPAVKDRNLPLLNDQQMPVILTNPISDNYSQYREYLFYEHLRIVIENWNKNVSAANFFELNSTYWQDDNKNFIRKNSLCISHGGELNYNFKNFNRLNYSLTTIRDVFLKIISMMNIDTNSFAFIRIDSKQKWFNQHNFHHVYFQEQLIGFCGEIKSQQLTIAKHIRRLFVLEIKTDSFLDTFRNPAGKLFDKGKKTQHQSPTGPRSSQLQEHWLTFLVKQESYHVIITRAISCIKRNYEYLWATDVVDCFYDKNAEKYAITLHLLFDFNTVILSRTEIEKILWKIKTHFEELISEYENQLVI